MGSPAPESASWARASRQTANTAIGCAQQTLQIAEIAGFKGDYFLGSRSPWPWPFLLCTGCSHTVAVSGTRAEGGSRHSGATVPLASGVTRLYLKPLHIHDSFQRDRAVCPVHNPFFLLPHLLQATHLGCPTHCGEREVSVPAWPWTTSPGTVAGWGKK